MTVADWLATGPSNPPATGLAVGVGVPAVVCAVVCADRQMMAATAAAWGIVLGVSVGGLPVVALAVAVAVSIVMLDRRIVGSGWIAAVGLAAAAAIVARPLFAAVLPAEGWAQWAGPVAAVVSLLGLGPLLTLTTAAGKQANLVSLRVLWFAVAVVLVRADGAVMASRMELATATVYAMLATILPASLLAYAHSDLRVRIAALSAVVLPLAMLGMLVGDRSHRVGIAATIGAAGLIAASGCVNRLQDRYASAEKSDYSGLGSLDRVWSAVLVVGLLATLLGVHLSRDSLRWWADLASRSDDAEWAATGHWRMPLGIWQLSLLAGAAAVTDTIAGVVFGRLDRPVFSPPLFEAHHGPEAPLLHPVVATLLLATIGVFVGFAWAVG